MPGCPRRRRRGGGCQRLTALLFSENHPQQKASSTLAHRRWGLRGVQLPAQCCGLLPSITRGPACPRGPSVTPRSFPIRPLSLSLGSVLKGTLPLAPLNSHHRLCFLDARHAGISPCWPSAGALSVGPQTCSPSITGDVGNPQCQPRCLTCRPADPETGGSGAERTSWA